MCQVLDGKTKHGARWHAHISGRGHIVCETNANGKTEKAEVRAALLKAYGERKILLRGFAP